jgi:presenilin-like A22 family membrane protease
MKHTLKITLVLIAFFLLAQLVGLGLISKSITGIGVKDGVASVEHTETILGERPQMSGGGAFLYVVIGVAIGTALVLLLIKFKQVNFWKAWFFLAVFIAISLSLGVLIQAYLAMILAVLLAIFKIYRPNIVVHNLTEVLMYSGIALFLAPMLTVFWASMLLIAIAVYDFIAVFKSKHMVKMAEFQSESKVFAGLFIPYSLKKAHGRQPVARSESSGDSKTLSLPKDFSSSKVVVEETKNAVLGGGDIAFPLIFTGVVMDDLVLQGLSKAAAFSQSLIITLFVTIALAGLFFFAKKDKFYPAMPVISAGCFIGYGVLLLIQAL